MTEARLRGWVLVAAQAALLAVLVLAPTGDLWPVPGPLRVLGGLLKATGAAAVGMGALRLGRALSVHPEPTPGARLRTDGPYRYVRHPIYAGVLALAAGIAMTAASPDFEAKFVASDRSGHVGKRQRCRGLPSRQHTRDGETSPCSPRPSS